MKILRYFPDMLVKANSYNFSVYLIRGENKLKIAKILIASIIILVAAYPAYAARCRCCGKSYGAAAPGDSARVNALRRSHESSCCAGRGSGGSTSGGYSPEAIIIKGIGDAVRQGVQRALDDSRRRKQEARNYANQLNEAGLDFSRRGKYKEAAEQYRLALEYWPGEPTITENLRRAEQNAEESQRRAIEHEKWKQAQQAIGGMLDDLASQWGATGSSDQPIDMDFAGSQAIPSDDSLEFVASKEPLFSKGTKESAPVDLTFDEGTRLPVVDPRVVKGEMTAEEARTARQNALKAQSSIMLGALMTGQGDYDKALSYLREAQKLRPDDLGIKKAIGYTLYLRDKKSGMVASPKAGAILDALEYGKGDWQASTNYLKDWYRMDPENLPVRDALNFTEGMGGCLLPPNEIPLPSGYKAPSQKGKVHDSTINKAMQSFNAGEYEKAYNYYKKAHEQNPEDLGVRDMMNFSEGSWAALQTE